ncbi:hypothetical protein, partial [Faecalibaculum rodentium]|uniref:hypothetical protein n=1 Tax=Faecalibaculum rodentium TaxID=1702221 RepID=UPI002731EBD5
MNISAPAEILSRHSRSDSESHNSPELPFIDSPVLNAISYQLFLPCSVKKHPTGYPVGFVLKWWGRCDSNAHELPHYRLK